MATDLSSERDGFNKFIDERLGGGSNGLSLEQALTKYRQYQRELEEARAKLRAAEDDVVAGRISTLDWASFSAEMEDEFDKRGIPE
jgi:hypothetical protein